MGWWIWIATWFLFCFRYSRLFEYLIKKHETLTTIPPICVYIDRINNRLFLKIKDGYKLELKKLETMKLLWHQKKTKNGETVPSFEVVEIVLVQCNLLNNQYQEKSEVLYLYTPTKSYAYLLHVNPSNLVLLKTYNTEFDEIIITFTDQTGRLLEI